MNKIRTLITLPRIPIYSYAYGNSKADIIRKYYYDTIVLENSEEILNRFKITVDLLGELRSNLKSNLYKDNILVYESAFWGIYICLFENRDLSIKNIGSFAEIINGSDKDVPQYMWENISEDSKELRIIYEQTGSHYYKSINNRYIFISNFIGKYYNINYAPYLKNNEAYKEVMEANEEKKIFERYKLNKTDPVSITIYDIMKEMEKSRFLIRPSYQRSEVVNQQKSSYLLESMLLGIKIPPLFIYKRKDGVKEVIDGQQRLLTLIGFLGKSYINEKGEIESSKKDSFKISKLRILEDLNGKSILDIDSKYEDVLWDFPLDIVEIDEEQNPDFSAIDLFLRLNTKPYPIKDNTFEMWNAYVDKDIILKVRSIADENEGKVFRPKDTRMKNEELITSLGYLEYKFIKDKIQPNELLGIYIRNGKLSGRVKSKESVTKTLSEASSTQDKKYITALEKVEDFIDKINYLVDYEYSNLGHLFATKKGIQSKTDQNFYFLWLMLHGIPKSKIKQRSGKYADLITLEFKKIQKLDECDEAEQIIKGMMNLLR